MTSTPRQLRLGSEVRSRGDIAAVEAVIAYWAAQDVEMTVSMFADDIVYQLYVSRSAQHICIERTGRSAVRSMLYDLLADFDYLSYEADILEVNNGVARVHTSYIMRHRATGDELAGSKRFVCTLKNGLFTRLHEYHDAALVEAFMKLAKWRLGEQEQPASIESVIRSR